MCPITKPQEMQVLVLGMPRTGTTSIRSALAQLGYGRHYYWDTLRCAHNKPDVNKWTKLIDRKFNHAEKIPREEFDELLHGYASLADWPCALFVEDLIDAYPEAKVILSTRDSPEAWCRSFGKTVWEYNRRRFVPDTVWERFWSWTINHEDPLTKNVCVTFHSTRLQSFPSDGAQWYIDHCDLVRRHTPRDRFLEFNAKQGWEPLCQFLGKEVPDRAFPDLNHSARFEHGSNIKWTIFRFNRYHAFFQYLSRVMLGIALLSSLLAFASSRGVFKRFAVVS